MKSGQSVKIKVATVTDRLKLVPKSFEGGEVKTFTIISVPNDHNQQYCIMVDDTMVGWTINAFHVEYSGVDKKFLGKKFFDVDETYFVE